MFKPQIRTKLVCTIGPSTWDEKTLRKMIELGMSVARINASFADAEEIRRVTQLIRSLSDSVAIMLDLKGHKIRLSDFKEPIEVKTGDTIILETQPNDKYIYVSYPNLHNDIKIGNTILIDDGKIRLIVQGIHGTQISAVAQNDGVIKRLKTVNVPGVYLNFEPLTSKDKEDIKAGIEVGVDFIAGSFIRNVNDVRAIKNEIRGTNISVIAKIEDPFGVENFDEILDEVYGILIARGDLGVELPCEEVPILQKVFISKCRKLAKPVIVATHMLESMISNPRPTRAEVNDVANAIFDQADAIMTSAETSTGQYPLEVVNMMHSIACKTENYVEFIENPFDDLEQYNSQQVIEKIFKANHKNDRDAVARAIAIANAVVNIYKRLKNELKAIIVLTKEGLTARLISAFGINLPIYAFTPNKHTAKQLTLSKSVYPFCISDLPDTRDEAIKMAIQYSKQNHLVNNGDLVLIVIGSQTFQNTSASALDLERIS